MNFEYYSNMEPMKYYQPLDYNSINAQAMIANENHENIAMQKFDGEWCRIIKWDGKIIAQSRTISKVTGKYGDKTELIPHIIKEFDGLPDGTVLIGELCWKDITKTSKDVGTILRCKPPKAIERQKNEKLIFRTFDCLAYNGVDYSKEVFIVRFNALLNALLALEPVNGCGMYIWSPVFVYDNFEDFLQEILSQGGEGIVIHSKNYIYAPGKRPAWTTLKVKKITTELELLVVEFIEPNKSYEGKELDSWEYWEGKYIDTNETVRINHVPGNIDLEASLEWYPVTKPYWNNWKNGIIVNHNGTLVRVASGLTDADREWLATNDALIALKNGQLYAVVSAMEVDKESGSLRHPRLIRLRTDI